MYSIISVISDFCNFQAPEIKYFCGNYAHIFEVYKFQGCCKSRNFIVEDTKYTDFLSITHDVISHYF